MAYTAAVLDSQIDVSNIRDLLVQGDAAFPTINFTLPAGFTGLTWRVRGTFMQFNLATQSGELAVTGSTTISIAWPVGSNFTTYYGEMQIVLVGTDAIGNIVTKATGYVNVQRDFSISTVEIVDENLFEQLMEELSSSSVMLDQATEQEIINGIPKLAEDRVISDDHHIVDKKHVEDTALQLDQTTPQELSAPPTLKTDRVIDNAAQIVDKKYVDQYALGGSGFAANLYFTTINSDVSGYKKVSYTAEATETELTIPTTTTEILARSYVFDSGLGVTVIDGGKWSATYRAKVSGAQGASFRIEAFLRHVDNTETTLFSAATNKIINTSYETLEMQVTQPSFQCAAIDRLGFRLYASTTHPAGITLYTIVGDGNASYINTPIALRHSQLRDLNGGTDYQHLTAAQLAIVNNTSGTNTGDQDVSGAISTHNTDAGAHANIIAPFRRPLNGLYDGVDLSTVFATAADFRAAIAARDFGKIKVGDYWPITITGTFRDYSSYTVPSSTTYYSDAGLTTTAGTAATTYEGLYASATAVSFTISSTTYYVAIGACLAYYERALSNAIMKCEVAAINPYITYGDTALSADHVILISRDCIPTPLKMRAADAVWYNPAATNPWLGSALYETLNNPTYGLLALIAATDIGTYLHAGPNGKGMRWMGETKAAGVATPTSWSWLDRGKLFLPFEPEIWGQSVFADNALCKALTNQLDIFRGSMRHIVKGLGNGGSRCAWWCASATSGSSAFFAHVSYIGFPTSSNAVNALGVPACFLIS